VRVLDYKTKMALALHVRFKSFGEFKAVFDDFCTKGFHPMKIVRSHRKGLEGKLY
jgi:hypothetical protein